jgi:hypothetical protein
VSVCLCVCVSVCLCVCVSVCLCVCVNSATDALGLFYDGLSRLRAGLLAHLGAAVN